MTSITLQISILAFTDDIVILAKTEEELQKILKCIENWCKKWRLKVNTVKTNVVHFRNKRKKKTNFYFKFEGVSLDIVEKYKYLGNIFNEHLVISTVLAGAAGKALGSVISKFKALKNIGYYTFFKMYHSYVVPIMDYGSGVCDNSEAGDKIQFRAIRYYLGVHPKTPLLALEGGMAWNSCKIRQHLNIIHLYRLINMDENRLTK